MVLDWYSGRVSSDHGPHKERSCRRTCRYCKGPSLSNCGQATERRSILIKVIVILVIIFIIIEFQKEMKLPLWRNFAVPYQSFLLSALPITVDNLRSIYTFYSPSFSFLFVISSRTCANLYVEVRFRVEYLLIHQPHYSILYLPRTFLWVLDPYCCCFAAAAAAWNFIICTVTIIF